jgi:hypothetical protein
MTSNFGLLHLLLKERKERKKEKGKFFMRWKPWEASKRVCINKNKILLSLRREDQAKNKDRRMYFIQ